MIKIQMYIDFEHVSIYNLEADDAGLYFYNDVEYYKKCGYYKENEQRFFERFKKWLD